MFVGQGSSRKLKYLFILLLAIDLFDQQTLAIDQSLVDVNDACSAPAECELVCSSVENIGATTDRMFDQTCPDVDMGQFLFLTIENVTFDNRRIPQRWFGGRYALYALTFRHCDFDAISKEAFHENAFNVLKVLRFENVTHFVLESGQFTGIDELSELSFLNSALSHIDERFMQQIARYLYTFEMVAAERSTVKVEDLLERTTMPFLWSFHLECAQINSEVLSEKNLVALTVVHTLKLIDCQIAAITATAFDRISGSLKLLHLQRNRLKTLDENIFDQLMLKGVAAIGLADNPWMCTASAMALAEKMQKNDLLLDLSNCTVMPMPSQPPPTGTPSTTPVPPSIVSCANMIKRKKEFSIKYDPRIQKVTIKVFPRDQMFLFRLYVILSSHAIKVNELRTCEKGKNQRCFGFLMGPGTVIKLPMNMAQINSVHTICLLEELHQSTHPLHCISLTRTTEKVDHQNTWIPMSARIWLIPTLVVFYTLAFALGLAIAFGIFKMRPRLLRGCRRVVVVVDRKSRGSTVLIMPKEWSSNRVSRESTADGNVYERFKPRSRSLPSRGCRLTSVSSVTDEDDYESIYETIDPIDVGTPKPIYTILK